MIIFYKYFLVGMSFWGGPEKLCMIFDFVIIILRSNTLNGQRRKKVYVLLSCERKDKYMRYKKYLQVIESESRKCDYPIILREGNL